MGQRQRRWSRLGERGQQPDVHDQQWLRDVAPGAGSDLQHAVLRAREHRPNQPAASNLAHVHWEVGRSSGSPELVYSQRTQQQHLHY